ncbi:N-acetyltransferase [Bartonella sp. TP]|uniref:GNAT family N-acetyltransferase n=1 Tax=Bartonella sp. TP TaxID=3057550 RepID=UPI0025B08D99|nr:N-acetyltransferase [Bartonella sp. TP]WJW79703.1 N-acetyltransferase [Bartonella sp. TP]
MSNFKFNTKKKQDCEQINKLHAKIFGPTRFTKAAHLLRERGHAEPDLSFTIYDNDKLIGSSTITPIKLGQTKAFLLGPVGIDSNYRDLGLGSQLITMTINKIKEAPLKSELIMLIGDIDYYKKFGFAKLNSRGLILPAPVNPARILLLELSPGASQNLSGLVLPYI